MTLVFFLTSVVLLTTVVTNCAQTTCSEGTYLLQFDEKSFCEECPPGTFMPWKDHTASTCFECTKIENPAVEILISPCDRFHDADIQCKDGYFRRLARNPREKPTCLKCTSGCPQHHFQVHRCENFTDLGCCPGENYDFEYYHGNSGPRKCRERPWMCGRGEYLETSVNDCKPCPGNTFMPEDYHSYTNCWDCHYKSEAELPLHTVIAQNCTSTQPARYRCEDGFYMNHGMSYRGDDIGCSPCHSCDEGMYEVRQCDGYHDTVCCHKQNTPVVDVSPLRGQCIDKIDDLLLHPYNVESLTVREGRGQSIICYTALTKRKKKPLLTWVGPNVNMHQQFQFENENYQSGVTVYHNTLTVENFSTDDEGEYRCRYRDSVDNLQLKEQIIYLKLACANGTYSPPACDKTCSQYCLVSERIDGSPCDYNNGTCLFGCVEGYTGFRCDTPLSAKGRNDRSTTHATIALSFILALVLLVVTICVLYNVHCPGTGPKWWQRFAGQIFTPVKRSTAEDVEQQGLMMEEVVTTVNRGKDLSLDQVKTEVLKIVYALQQIVVFHSEEGIKCQKKIYQVFWDYFHFRTDIGDYLAELGMAEICMEIGKRYLKESTNIHDDDIWKVTDYTYRVSRSYSSVSSEFAKSLADLGAVQFLTEMLSQKPYLDNLTGERECLVVKSLIVGLRHLAVHAGNIHDFQQCGTIEVLERLTKSEDDSINALAKITIDSIGEEKEKIKLTDTPGPSKQTRENSDDTKSPDTMINEKNLNKIRQQFITNCIPMNIVHMFHFYKGDVLQKQDIDAVASSTSKNGRLHGASELWNRLIKYKDWYSCLLLVLRDPLVKQGHVADLMENIVGLGTLGSTTEKLKVDNTKLTEEFNKLKQENTKLKDEINQTRDKIEPLVNEAQTAKQGNAKLNDKINKKNQENAELRKEIHEAKQKSALLTDEINKKDHEMAKMTEEIKENNEKNAELTEEINNRDHQIATLMKKVMDLEDKLTEVQREKETTGPDVDLKVLRKDLKSNFSDEVMNEMRRLFVVGIDPENIIHIFHLYNMDVLTCQDIEIVTSSTSNHGRVRGASELWSRLVNYNDWYSCLLMVLRDTKVKQGGLADNLADIAGHRSGRLKSVSATHKRPAK